jgi:hypothetical protein
LLTQLADKNAFTDQTHQEIDKARQEAESLFRPKPKAVEISTTSDGPSDGPSDGLTTAETVRKPRILSAVPVSISSEAAASVVRQPPQPALSMVQFTDASRERLAHARKVLLSQQRELQARLETIDIELRAIDAYETAKRANS